MSFLYMSRKMKSLLSAVDEKNGRIITYLLRERHTGIRELADLIHASSDMEVLIRIRKVINPKAVEILGKPLFTFERSKIDSLTNEKITFSWWLKEELIDDLYDAELLDIFDEGNILRVITILPPQEKRVEVKVKNDFLIISGKEYHREIPLFYPVKEMVRENLNNAVLEVELKKSPMR
jgi:HSP20 family molecular chaperone IbpA